MHRAGLALVVMAWAGLAGGQGNPEYTQVANDFGAEFPYSSGSPIELRVEVLGVRFDTVAVTPQGEIVPGSPVRCEVAVDGSSVARKKAAITFVLLLEDAQGKTLERIGLDPFKVKSERSFSERQRRDVSGDALGSASKAYVFIHVDGP
ncbi:MAG: hypothetical protein ACM3O7_05995 [Acidobacteriota bacterium]